MTSNTKSRDTQAGEDGAHLRTRDGRTDARNDLRLIACDGQKAHLHDYRVARISINAPLCVFIGVGTARRAKGPRSAVSALHPSVFPRALCHHVRRSPSESPLHSSNKHKGRSRAPTLALPAAGQQRLRSETKTALEKNKGGRKKWGRRTRGRVH